MQITAGSDFEVKSDSKVTINAASTVTAPNISLLAEATGSALVKGLLANAAAEVNVNGATLTATGGTVTLSALGKVDMTGTNAEDGDTFFGNTIAGTVVTSFSTATVNVVGTTTITADTLNVTAAIDTDIEATVEDGTVKLLTVWAAGDARVNIGDANVPGTTTINVTDELTSEAKSEITIDAKSKPGSANTDSSLDAAVVNVNVVDVGIPVLVPAGFTSGADMTVGGGAVITAGTKATFKATDLIDVETTADGEVAGTAGATLAGTIVDSDTIAAITGNAAVTAPTVDLLASTTRTLVTTAKSTPGGAEDEGQTNNQSQQALEDNDAQDQRRRPDDRRGGLGQPRARQHQCLCRLRRGHCRDGDHGAERQRQLHGRRLRDRQRQRHRQPGPGDRGGDQPCRPVRQRLARRREPDPPGDHGQRDGDDGRRQHLQGRSHFRRRVRTAWPSRGPWRSTPSTPRSAPSSTTAPCSTSTAARST